MLLLLGKGGLLPPGTIGLMVHCLPGVSRAVETMHGEAVLGVVDTMKILGGAAIRVRTVEMVIMVTILLREGALGMVLIPGAMATVVMAVGRKEGTVRIGGARTMAMANHHPPITVDITTGHPQEMIAALIMVETITGGVTTAGTTTVPVITVGVTTAVKLLPVNEATPRSRHIHHQLQDTAKIRGMVQNPKINREIRSGSAGTIRVVQQDNRGARIPLTRPPKTTGPTLGDLLSKNAESRESHGLKIRVPCRNLMAAN